MIEAYRRLAELVPYPLHLGVTEAGTAVHRHRQVAPSASASLLADGHRRHDPRLALDRSRRGGRGGASRSSRRSGCASRGPKLIACPSCGRTNVEVHELAERGRGRVSGGYAEHFEVAVMGCAVNGPGEAGDADFGIAGGRDAGFIYAHGEVLRKVPQAELVDELFGEIDAWIAARHAAARARARAKRVIGVGRTRDQRAVVKLADRRLVVAARCDRGNPAVVEQPPSASFGASRKRRAGRPLARRRRRPEELPERVPPRA